MIPIECPKCGRGGNVPPDRLNARLVCKACHSVFFMDASGRMVLGEPGAPDKHQPKPRSQSTGPDFDPAQAWKDVPLPVKVGVPAVLVLLLGWWFNPFGGGGPEYQGRAEGIIQALAANDKAKAVSYALPATADAAGKWFDLMRGEVEKKKVGKDVSMSVALFDGNPASGDALTLWCIVYDNEIGTSSTVPLNLQMKRDGGLWKFDGSSTLAEASKATVASPGAKKN